MINRSCPLESGIQIRELRRDWDKLWSLCLVPAEIELMMTQLIQASQDFIEKFTFDTSKWVSGLHTGNCLLEFLDLLDPVHQLIADLEGKTSESDYQADYLYQAGWNDVCKLMVDTFYRTRRDEHFKQLETAIIHHNAVARVQQLLHMIDPDEQIQTHALVQQVTTLLLILRQWQAEADRPEPKPALFIFDQDTLEKVLNRQKSALITLKHNGDSAHRINFTYISLDRGETYRDRYVYERGKTSPIYAADGDRPAGYIRITGLDKDDLHFLASEQNVLRAGFVGNEHQSAPEQFQAWWDSVHQAADEQWASNPSVWIIHFHLLDTDA